MNGLQMWSPNDRRYWDPFRMIDELKPSMNWATVDDGLDVYEDDGTVFAEASLPGIDAKDVDVTYEYGMLRIHADSESKSNGEKSKKRKNYREARIKHFEYMATLPRPTSLMPRLKMES